MAKENELAAQIAAIQRAIIEAPRVAAETAERERESILNATRGHHRHRATLVDPRHSAVEEPRRRGCAHPTLRAERQAARRQALALLALFGAVLAWAACTYLQ